MPTPLVPGDRADLGWITVDVVVVGTTYDRSGEAVPVVTLDVPGLGFVRLRGHRAVYWEAAVEALVG